jgi:predicted N-formylglutamate amidohydrolase
MPMILANERDRMDDVTMRLLAADEPPPVTIIDEARTSPFVIVADHAGNAMPRGLQNLGLEASEYERHIAWDIGIGAVSRLIGEVLGAAVIMQNYSRLVIDCNRVPGSETSIVEVSELTAVPGNTGLGQAQVQARVAEIFQPYHAAITGELERRRLAGRATALVAMHSFTPVFKSVARPWHVGVLYNRDPRLAHILLELLRGQHDLVVGDNEPYSVSDASDYTIPVHGEQRGLHHVAIEIRQDLIADEAGQRRWADLFARLLPQVCGRLDG